MADLQAGTFKQAYAEVQSPEDIEAYCLAHYTAEGAAAKLSSERTVCYLGLWDSEPSGRYIVKHHPNPLQAFYAKLGFASAGTGLTLEVGQNKLQSSMLVLELDPRGRIRAS